MSSTKANTRHVAKGADTTRINLIEFQYEWTILHFSFHNNKKGEALLSPEFSMGSRGEYKWQLKIYPNGDNTGESAGYLSVFLVLVPNEKAHAKGKFKFSISNTEKQMEFDQHFGEESLEWGFRKFVERDFLLNKANGLLLPNNTLTLVCDLTVIEDVISATKNADPVGFKVFKRSLANDFGDLFESSRLCDVTLIACGREFQAHKAILAARSSVFSAMFEHEMKEQQENRVNIIDVDDKVLDELLWFIYTRKTNKLDKMADDLLAAADKYQLDELKSLCEKELWKSLSIENVSSRLIIADLYGTVHLKAQALNFIVTHAKEVMETDSYNSMVNSHPHLINEAFLMSVTESNRLKCVCCNDAASN